MSVVGGLPLGASRRGEQCSNVTLNQKYRDIVVEKGHVPQQHRGNVKKLMRPRPLQRSLVDLTKANIPQRMGTVLSNVIVAFLVYLEGGFGDGVDLAAAAAVGDFWSRCEFRRPESWSPLRPYRYDPTSIVLMVLQSMDECSQVTDSVMWERERKLEPWKPMEVIIKQRKLPKAGCDI